MLRRNPDLSCTRLRRDIVLVPGHDGHDFGPMPDSVRAAWRTVFRPHVRVVTKFDVPMTTVSEGCAISSPSVRTLGRCPKTPHSPWGSRARRWDTWHSANSMWRLRGVKGELRRRPTACAVDPSPAKAIAESRRKSLARRVIQRKRSEIDHVNRGERVQY